jgi:hypothetical protein
MEIVVIHSRRAWIWCMNMNMCNGGMFVYFVKWGIYMNMTKGWKEEHLGCRQKKKKTKTGSYAC